MFDYKINFIPSTDEIIDLYKNAGLNRPIHDCNRITKMYSNSNLIISAWDDDILVGISRALTDFCFCCYLSDLAVRHNYQKQGIGERLIAITKEQSGNQASLILIAAPNAIDYYPKVGFETLNGGFIIKRTN